MKVPACWSALVAGHHKTSQGRKGSVPWSMLRPTGTRHDHRRRSPHRPPVRSASRCRLVQWRTTRRRYSSVLYISALRCPWAVPGHLVGALGRQRHRPRPLPTAMEATALSGILLQDNAGTRYQCTSKDNVGRSTLLTFTPAAPDGIRTLAVRPQPPGSGSPSSGFVAAVRLDAAIPRGGRFRRLR